MPKFYCPTCDTDYTLDSSSTSLRCGKCGDIMYKLPTDYGRSVGQLVSGMQDEPIERIFKKYGGLAGKKVRTVFGTDQEVDFLLGSPAKPYLVCQSKYLSKSKQAHEKAAQIIQMHRGIEMREDIKDLEKGCVIVGAFTEGPREELAEEGEKVMWMDRDSIAENFQKYDIELQWRNDDLETPRETWKKIRGLTESERRRIADKYFEGTAIEEELEDWLKESTS